MKKKSSIKLLILSLLIIAISACKKNYIIGGDFEDINRYANTTTYDLLKMNPLYDTLVQVIDAAGFKDMVNAQGSTFFAPSDYSIFTYMNLRTKLLQATNATSKFALDSLLYYMANNVKGTRDSLGMYLIKQPLTYTNLTNTGSYYPTMQIGKNVIISYESTYNTTLGYNPNVSVAPRLVYFTLLWYPYNLNDANPASKIPLNIGVHTLVKTSCIPTKTGIMNALENSHVLFFYGTKQ